MNDLSNASLTEHQTSFSCKPIPSLALYTLLPLFFIGLFVSIFILAVVHNAAFFLSFLLLSALVASFLAWNAINWRHHNRSAFMFFLNSFPDSDLRLAREGQLVKVTGVHSHFKVPSFFLTAFRIICGGFVIFLGVFIWFLKFSCLRVIKLTLFGKFNLFFCCSFCR